MRCNGKDDSDGYNGRVKSAGHFIFLIIVYCKIRATAGALLVHVANWPLDRTDGMWRLASKGKYVTQLQHKNNSIKSRIYQLTLREMERCSS